MKRARNTAQIKSDKKMFGSHSYGEVTVPLKEIGAKGPKKRWCVLQ
jgi:hypothetical protein